MHATAAILFAALTAPCLAVMIGSEQDAALHTVVKTVFHTVFVTRAYVVSRLSITPDLGTTVSSTPIVVHDHQLDRSKNIGSSPCSSASTRGLADTTKVTPSVTAAPAHGAADYMALVDEWRTKMGLKALMRNATLEANTMDTVVSSNSQMVHKLNPGTLGRVLAPGNADDFEHVFVGGWLCEIPSLPGLQGVCAAQSNGWAYNGQTGHAEILTFGDYSAIGCALHAGIWCCDLA